MSGGTDRIPPHGTDPDAVRTFQLHPAARLLWRSVAQVQLELGGRSVVVDGLDAAVVRELCAPSTAPAPVPRGDAVPRSTSRVLATLAEAGYLWPRGVDHDPDPRLTPPAPRLASDLAALTLRHGDGAADVLAARRLRQVMVHGTGRLAAGVASVLAAAGVGFLGLVGTGPAALHAAAPGGLLPGDEGRGFQDAAADAVRRAAPDASVATGLPDPYGDLAVLTGIAPVDPALRDELHAADVSHLVVTCIGERGVVGPLVVPGRTGCLRCGDLHRLDRDHAWSALAVQLATGPRYAPAVDVALASAVAGLTAVHVLAHLDGATTATLGGSLELHLPDWRLRRRSWPPHPACDCGARPEPPPATSGAPSGVRTGTMDSDE